MSVRFTQGNVADNAVAEDMTTDLLGSLFGDKGYIAKDLFASLWKQGLKLVTGIKSNMKNKLMPMHDKCMLRKRGLIESVFNVLKNNFEIEHSRHRSVSNAFVHMLSTLVAYCFKPTKLSLKHSPLLAM